MVQRAASVNAHQPGQGRGQKDGTGWFLLKPASFFVSKLLRVPIDLLPTRSAARDKGRRRDGGDKSSAVKLGGSFC